MRIRIGHDIRSITKIRQKKSIHIHLNLFKRRIYQRHVDQGIWHSSQIDLGRRRQPIYTPFDLCICYCDCSVYPYTNELFQQSIKSIFDEHVSILPDHIRTYYYSPAFRNICLFLESRRF